VIVPVAAAPPVTPFTCQFTDVFDDPVTVAVNVWLPPTRTLALLGNTDTLMPPDVVCVGEDDVFELLFVMPEHPACRSAPSTSSEIREARRITMFTTNRSLCRNADGATTVWRYRFWAVL
jgi:hypothetical protein